MLGGPPSDPRGRGEVVPRKGLTLQPEHRRSMPLGLAPALDASCKRRHVPLEDGQTSRVAGACPCTPHALTSVELEPVGVLTGAGRAVDGGGCHRGQASDL